MAFTEKRQAQATGGSSITSMTVAYPGSVDGCLLVAIIRNGGVIGSTHPTSQVSDNINGNWTELTHINAGAGATDIACWYFIGSASGTPTVTVTFAGSCSSPGVDIEAFDPGGLVVSVDTTITNTQNQTVGSTTTVFDAPSAGASPATNNSLVIIGASRQQSDFSSQTQSGYVKSGTYTTATPFARYWIQTSATAVADTVTWTASVTPVSLIVAFNTTSSDPFPLAHGWLEIQQNNAVYRMHYQDDLSPLEADPSRSLRRALRRRPSGLYTPA